MTYPVKVKMKAAVLGELHSCEYGSYEDNCREGERTEGYDKGELHIVELIERSPHKTVVYLEDEAEVTEFFVQAVSGTFGLYHLGTCLRLWNELSPLVDPKIVARYPRGNCGN